MRKKILNPILIQIKNDVGRQNVMVFWISGDGILKYEGILCVTDVDGFRGRFLIEANDSCYIFILVQ